MLRPLIRHAELRLGTLIANRYWLHGLLGTGSSGAVYGAIDRQTQQPVAIKVLHEGLQGSTEHVARFEREAKAASAVGSPYVVTVLDAGRDPSGSVYMVMELLAGQSMFYAIQEGTLSPERTVCIGVELLTGLQAVHERGIIHRDVKPENIFLERLETGLDRVRLLDFGIAKCLGVDAGSYSTADGFVVGTPHYMSPELCAGEPVTPAADLWAAGAVLFHAFAGEPPFDDEHLGRLLLSIVQGATPSLAVFRPDLPQRLVDIIEKSLQKEPARRWKAAADFRAALEGTLAQSEFETLH